MSLILTIPQLREMSEGGVPESFKGKIKKVWKRRGGTNEHGEWTLQTIVITDGTNDIDLSFNNRDEVPASDVGKMIYVQATRGDRGLQGTKRKDYTPNGKPTQAQVSVTAAADVSFEGAAQAQAQTQSRPANNVRQAEQPRQAPPRQAAPNQPANPPQEQQMTKADAVRRAMQLFNVRLGKSTSALNRCFDAAIKLEKDLHAQYPTQNIQFTSTDLKDIAMGLMVNACWTEKPADVIDFPTKPFAEYAAKATGTDHAQPTSPLD
jgi:hypothetical protein